MESLHDFARLARQPFAQWDRLRHPYAGWARIGLGLIFPIAVWSHSIVLLLLLVLAVIGHGYWFPSYVSADEDEPVMTRLMDGWQAWLDATFPAMKILVILPGAFIILPLVCFLWHHSIFWSVYFGGFAVIYKSLFGYILLNAPDTESALPQGKRQKKTGSTPEAAAKAETRVKARTKGNGSAGTKAKAAPADPEDDDEKEKGEE